MSISVGDKFAMLTVLHKDVERSSKNALYWRCICSCGNETVVRTAKLNNGHTKSCGCLRRIVKPNIKHGKRKSPVYNVWRNMLNRCDNPKNKSYKYYGDRGITYDSRWSSFKNFIEDMGEPDHKMTLERVDVNLSYSKLNCKWDNRTNQNHNRRKLPSQNELCRSSQIGVSWSISRGKWHAKLVKNGEKLLSRFFTDELEAGKVYDDFSEIAYGDRPNGSIKETII